MKIKFVFTFFYLLIALSNVWGNENTKIYTVFLSRGHGHGSVFTSTNPLTNDELLNKLQDKCDGIDFIVRDLTKGNISRGSLYSELSDLKESLDGILIIGVLKDYRIAFTGLPTIVVYNLWEWDSMPWKLFHTGEEKDCILVGGPEYKDGKIITANLDRSNVCAPSKSAAMFEDLVDKVKLIQAIKKLKESRILSLSPLDYPAGVDYQGDRNKHFPEDYNETYDKAIKKSLGVEIVRVEAEEFYETYKKTNKQEAEKIAEQWIKAARTVTAAKSEIIRVARSYLAFEEIRKKYNCNAVSTFMRSLTGKGDIMKENAVWPGLGGKLEDMFWPGLALECGFKTRGIQAVCQDYPNILVTQLLGYFITGRPSMLGDISMIDTENSVDVLTHCGAPVNPYGDERIVPYDILTHRQSPVRDTNEPGSGTGLRVEWPVGEPVTIWKVYVLHKKIGLHTGTIVNGHDIYRNINYEDLWCRTNLITKVNAKEVRKHYFADAYGIHRAATLGDLREKIKNLAVLLGFNVIEEDL
jgi:hypothetical protein